MLQELYVKDQKDKKMKRNKIIINIIIAFGILFVNSSCHKKKKFARPPSKVTAQKVVKKTMPIYIDNIGHVLPIVSIQVRSRVEGQIENIFIKEGSYVKKGDLLFTIDPKPFQATLERALAVLMENRANLKLAEDKVRRYTPLVKENYISLFDFETYQTNVDLYKAIVLQNEADVEKAKVDLDYCAIYSPIYGKTGLLQIDVGNLIEPNSEKPITTINQISPIYVKFSIPQEKIPEAKKYHSVNELDVRASAEHVEKGFEVGKLKVINNEIDTQTGMIFFKAEFENKKANLWPGQYVQARLVLKYQKNSIVIPTQSIVYTTKGPKVYVIKKDNTIAITTVELSEQVGNEIIVTKGLKGDENLVLEGQLNLFPKAKVEIKEQK
jgi:membrane fusion protein, multidrug efflux system